MTDRYSGIVLCHEIAEFKEALPLWNDILAAAGDRMNEHYLRAMKDLIAVKGEFVGGCDIVREMFETGELKDLLSNNGIETRAA